MNISFPIQSLAKAESLQSALIQGDKFTFSLNSETSKTTCLRLCLVCYSPKMRVERVVDASFVNGAFQVSVPLVELQRYYCCYLIAYDRSSSLPDGPNWSGEFLEVDHLCEDDIEAFGFCGSSYVYGVIQSSWDTVWKYTYSPLLMPSNQCTLEGLLSELVPEFVQTHGVYQYTREISTEDLRPLQVQIKERHNMDAGLSRIGFGHLRSRVPLRLSGHQLH